MKSFVSVSADQRVSKLLKDKENKERASPKRKNHKLSLVCVSADGVEGRRDVGSGSVAVCMC
jgi:hypothetical protein